MRDAHLRFGSLTYQRMTEKVSTRITVALDRFIGEVSSDSSHQAKAHLVSVVGGDTQIGAVSAAVSMGEGFTIDAPGLESTLVSLGANAQCYRGTLQLKERRTPLRHAIAVSEEFAAGGSNHCGRTLLADCEANFVWASMAHIHGLPGGTDWGSWFFRQLERKNAMTPLLGIGCAPVLIKGSKQRFLGWLSSGVRSGELRLPAANGPITWPKWTLEQVLSNTITRSS